MNIQEGTSYIINLIFSHTTLHEIHIQQFVAFVLTKVYKKGYEDGLEAGDTNEG
ncbi:MAG: hypothetical protein KAR20_02015 [Candidatus Heimdallarchaeota archaeon]|nr:hypothetical protein [Candidatus Heimdallarchaeota archaeon]